MGRRFLQLLHVLIKEAELCHRLIMKQLDTNDSNKRA